MGLSLGWIAIKSDETNKILDSLKTFESVLNKDKEQPPIYTAKVKTVGL